MRFHQIHKHLDAIAPLRLAESWDKVGLHVGDPDAEVTRALLCIDLTEPVLDEAIEQEAQLILAYHPPIFQPLSAVTPGVAKCRVIYRAVRQGLVVYSPHTALDAARGGVNDWLCQAFGAGEARPIRPAKPAGASYKVVAFVPEEQADELRRAMSDAGAGVIGDYTECSFGLRGEGTFRGGEASSPTIGTRGQFERVPELRMEMVCAATRLAPVIDALRRTHLYEEPAFDIYPLEPEPGQAVGAEGQGRVVELAHPLTVAQAAQAVKAHLAVDHLEVAATDLEAQVKRVALCAGAGGSLLAEAGAIDLFLTGEMRHHDVLEARARGIAVLLAGHTQTERPYLPVLAERLAQRTSEDVTWTVSDADVAPSALV